MTPQVLGPDDIARILKLQDRVIDRYGPERIWVHQRSDLERLFYLGEGFLPLGVRSGKELIAVSLSRRMEASEVTPLVPHLPWSGEAAHIGLNTLSLPGGAVGPQMIRLLSARKRYLVDRGVHHLFGGVSPDHRVSLGCAFRAGAIGVGHLVVPGATELLLWNGPGRTILSGDDVQPVHASDIERQAALMREGFVVCGLDRKDPSKLLLSPDLKGV
jgi:hypothetical protein